MIFPNTYAATVSYYNYCLHDIRTNDDKSTADHNSKVKIIEALELKSAHLE